MAQPTKDPLLDAFEPPVSAVAPNKSPMSGKNPNLQPSPEFSAYSIDPLMSAFDPMASLGEMLGGPEQKTPQGKPGNPYVGKALQEMFKLRQGAYALGTSAADTILGLPSQIAGTGTYWGTRLLADASPERATQLSQMISDPLGYLQPGKQGLFNPEKMGVQQGSKAYEESIPARIMGLVNQYGIDPVKKMLVSKGYSPSDAEQAINAGLLMIGPAAKVAKIGVQTAPKLRTWADEVQQTPTGVPPRLQPLVDSLKTIKDEGHNLQDLHARLVGEYNWHPEDAQKAIDIANRGNQSVGAAQASPQAVMQGNVQAALANASPELQAHIQSKPLQSVNLPALETRALEEKHGVNLTAGQRTGDLNRYVDEWNSRGKTDILSNHFADQPKQLANAFENAKYKHAPDISITADASELGQHEINGLSSKDQIRKSAISDAYQKLTEANGGQFPIDVGTLNENIASELSKNLKTNHLPPAIATDLKDFSANPTFEGFEALRTNLANIMRSNADGNAKGASYIVRQELEKLPVFGEKNAAFDPKAAELKQLADRARSLVTERSNVIKSNPAYAKAINEAADLQQASSQGESLNAANFHKKFVSSATPEAIRRMKAEIPADDIAHQAITFGELDRAKNQQVNANATNTKSDRFADFLRKEAPRLKAALPPEAMQDVSELGLLSSKIGKPQAGVFNHSNSFNAYLRDMAAQGLSTAAEAKLATATGGASVPFTMAGKQWMLSKGQENFAKQATHPFTGLTKEQ